MNVDKKTLKRIIREELALHEQGQTSVVAQEAQILADLNDILAQIEEASDELYGLVDPGDPGVAFGDELAQTIGLQLERANDLYRAIERYFEERDAAEGRR